MESYGSYCIECFYGKALKGSVRCFNCLKKYCGLCIEKVCHEHCMKKTHGHCSIYSCNRTASCSIFHPSLRSIPSPFLCRIHCEEKGHNHCEVFGCGMPGDHCFEHCIQTDHIHCSVFCCNNIVERIDSDLCPVHLRNEKMRCALFPECRMASKCFGYCERHCSNKKHKHLHCIYYDCDKKGGCCEKHCTDKTHANHCYIEGCSSDRLSEGKRCIKHADEKKRKRRFFSFFFN